MRRGRGGLAVGLLAVAACGADPNAREEPEVVPPGEVRDAVVLRVQPDEVYRLGEEPLRAEELSGRLSRALRDADGNRTLRLYADQGVTGYDVVLAMNAARDAGFREVIGVSEYADDPATRARWVAWQADLRSGRGGPITPDTAAAD